MSVKDEAEKILKDHAKGSDEEKAKTRGDDLNDPKHNAKIVEIDAGWKQDDKGNWTHPEHP
jgi:hypothetical protein